MDSGAGRSEAARALRLFRSDRQRSRHRAVLPRGNEAVVQMAEPAEPATELHVGGVRGVAEAVPVAETASASTPILSERE